MSPDAPDGAPDLASIDGILAALQGGQIDTDSARDALLHHFDEMTGQAGLMDTFASLAHVTLDEQGYVPRKQAEILMGGPIPPGMEAFPLRVLQWYAEAEARWRYVKAAAAMKAREI